MLWGGELSNESLSAFGGRPAHGISHCLKWTRSAHAIVLCGGCLPLGLGQFIAGLYGFAARDVLVTVIQ